VTKKQKLLDELARLKAIENGDIDDDPMSLDTEATHCCADQALLDYISDDDIEAAFDAIPKWYA
jgi:hypothetical protein